MKLMKSIVSIVGTALTVATAGVAIKNAAEVKTDEEVGHKQGFYEKYVKRPQDFFCASAATIVLSPVLAGTALLVKAKLGSPVLFTQERPGCIDYSTGKERVFKLYKFRTMTNETDENGELLPDEDRLTDFGKILRSTSLDELPELFNIINGDMAVVGPRPLLVKYLSRYSATQRRRHEVRPGLTGLAMATVRNSVGWGRKFELDVQYVDEVSFLMDLKIILWTIRIVAKRESINEPGSVTNSEFKGGLEGAEWKQY